MGGPETRRTQTPAPGTGEWAAAWTFAALALISWWMRAPYPGLARDAEFYALDALRYADPGFLTGDLYFAHGTQGRYSLFIAPYAALAQHLGIQVAAVATTVLLRLLWLAGAWRLLQRLAPEGSAAVWALGAICLIEGVYHPQGVLRYGEPFATPRLAAEATTLFAIAALVAGQRARAAALAVLACALHPLLGWPALALVTVLAGVGRPVAAAEPPRLTRRLLCVGGLLLGGLASAAVLGVPIAERLLQRYDATWWSWVVDRNALTVIQAMPVIEALDLLATLPLLALAGHGRHDTAALLARSTAAIAAGALLMWLGACASHAILPIQLQLWRVLWLVLWLAAALWALRLARSDVRAPDTQILAGLLLAMTVAPTGWQLPLVIALGLRLQAGPWLDAHLRPRAQRALMITVLLLWTVPAAWPTGGLIEWGTDTVARLQAPWVAMAGIPARRLLACVTGAALALWLARRVRVTAALPAWAAPAAALAWMAATVVVWLLAAQQAWAPPAPWIRALQREIPPGTVIHWDQPARVTWFELQRPAWLVSEHGAPLLFFRGLALDWEARVRRARSLDLEFAYIRGRGADRHIAGRRPLDLPRARGLCADTNLGVVLLEGVVPGADRVLRLPARSPLSLVDCQHHRDGSPSAVSGPP